MNKNAKGSEGAILWPSMGERPGAADVSAVWKNGVCLLSAREKAGPSWMGSKDEGMFGEKTGGRRRGLASRGRSSP